MRLKIACFVFLLSCYACSSDDVNPEDECTSSNSPPEFTSDPVLITNSENVEFQVQTNIPANIYFVVSENAISDKSPAEIKAKAESGTGSLRSGSFQIQCETLDTLNSMRIANLPKDTQLYAYIVAESFKNKLQEQTTEFSFIIAENRVVTKTFNSSVKERESLYVLYLPTENRPLDDGVALQPLIIFLGGNSEVSPPGQITVVQNGSVPEYVAKGNHLPFIVIAPEHNTSSWNADYVKEVIDHAIQTYPVDPDRIIVTGLSGGGNGTLTFAFKYPNVPAALVPISGWADNLSNACELTNTAVWLFHNEDDPKVATGNSIKVYDALKNCFPTRDDIKLTIFRDPGHIAWLRVYDPTSPDWNLDTQIEPIDIYDWMYDQSR